MSNSFPEFVLERIRLRKIRPQEVSTVYAGLSNPVVTAHYGVSYSSLEATDEQMRWFERILTEKTGIWWAIADLESDAMLGACGLNDKCHEHRRIKLGYWLLPEYWRQGYLSKALPVILRHAFRHMGVHRIHADVEPENVASWALLEKVGFQREGTLRDVEFKGGHYLSLHQYSLLADDAAALALCR
ncbi:GNAT family acetyltransferase [Pseudomonas sp. Leaf127]|uniref:GNAT family N-acetyltransferase n=1 Tax=Pseudomonas sp. Leaf127 TaxID=1736267 RepID=UPI000703206C|nr:GNAT family protein [Pseudomonas sp. Leaf127]KQQ56362.1 GNAT family acetyltransferase [Pseudomonas sp. Leaf127]